MKWKKMFSILLMSLMILSSVPFAFADTTYNMETGDSVTYEGKVLTMERIGSVSVMVDVDDEREVVYKDVTTTLNGLTFTVDQIYYIEDDSENLATITIHDSGNPGYDEYDTNQDGVVNQDDWYFCGEFMQNHIYNDRCDFDNDGAITPIDLSTLARNLDLDENVLPDLIVEDISFSPSNPDEEDNVYVTVVIKNQGEATASNFWVGLYEFYGATQVTSSDADEATSSKTVSGYTLGAGERMSKTFGPYRFTAGQHTMMAWADMFNSVEESNENNNVRYETVEVDETTSSNVIYRDTFSEPTLRPEWKNYQGLNPTIVDGELDLPYFGEGGHNMRIVDMNPGTANYIVTAKLKVVSDNSYDSGDTRATTLVARFQNSGTFYKAGINERNNAFIIEKHVNGVKSFLDYTYHAGSVAVEQDTWYDVRFEVDGNTLRLYIDGELQKEAIDTSISSGKFGIRNGEAHSRVDDFIVYRLDDSTVEPPVGDFSVSIDTDKRIYSYGDLVRISVKIKGQNVDVEDANLNVRVKGGGQEFGVPMTRGVCTSSNTGIMYCNWEGYFDTMLNKDDDETLYVAYVTAEIDDEVKHNKIAFTVKGDIVVPENLVEVSISPTYQSVYPGNSAAYKVTIKDNHPSYSSQAYFTYNLVVSGLPFKDTLPNTVTLKAGEEITYKMYVYTAQPLKVEVLYAEDTAVEVEYEDCKDSDGGIDYYEYGKISGSMPPEYIAHDMCLGNKLRETYCDKSDSNNDGYIGTTYLYTCPNGCSNGVCLRFGEDGDSDEGSSGSVGYAVEVAQYCTDTDGGIDYYTAGRSSSSDQNVEGKYDCCKENAEGGPCYEKGDYLHEAYCSGNDPVSVMYKCKYGCQAGACLRSDLQVAQVMRISTSSVEVELAPSSSDGGYAVAPVRFHNSVIYTNQYYGKTYSFKIHANLQGQYNVRDVAYASLFVGNYQDDGEEDVEDETIEVPDMPEIEMGNTYVVGLEKGWNIISIPGRFTKFKGCSGSRKLLGFVYLKDKQEYVTLKEAERLLGKGGLQEYLLKNAFWVYSYNACKLEITVKSQTSYKQVDLVRGWNLVPVTKDMIGGSLRSIEADCSYKTLYFWKDGEWSRFSENYVFDSSDLTKGFVAKVDQACTLGLATLTPPDMPEE